jgi:GT2 family glycosyltransferase/protein-L-isoaspartate O-methyltransferase
LATNDRNVVDLEWTGERYVPGVEGDVAVEHLHRYALARELVQGKDVLDIACGEGYGSHLLSDVARSVTGVDVAENVVAHAKSRYVRPGLRFELGHCAKIPLGDGSVDVVVSFETVEHHDKHQEMLDEFKRVLRPGGIVIVSSPDKNEYTDASGNKNPFHVKELYLNEFRTLLQGRFRHVALYGQRVHYGSVVAPLEPVACGSWFTFAGGAGNVRAVPGIERPLYYIAIASDEPLASLPVGIFLDPKAIWRRDQQIAALDRSVETHKNLLASATEAADQAVAALARAEAKGGQWETRYRSKQAQLEELGRQFAKKGDALNTALAERRELEQRGAVLYGSYAEAIAQAKQLEVANAQLDERRRLLDDKVEELRKAHTEATLTIGRLESELAMQRKERARMVAEIERQQREVMDSQRDAQAQVEARQQLRNQLQLRERSVARLTVEIAASKAEEKRSNQERDFLRSLLRDAIESLKEAETRNETTRGQLGKLTEALHSIEVESAEREHRVAVLSQSLADVQFALDRVSEEIVRRDAHITALENEVERREQVTQNARGSLEELRGRFAILENEQALLLGSISWRMTAPLRTTKNFLMRLPALPRQIAVAGGLWILDVYHSLPIRGSTRILIKDFCFRRLPWFFRRLGAYQTWQVVQNVVERQTQATPSNAMDSSEIVAPDLIDLSGRALSEVAEQMRLPQSPNPSVSIIIPVYNKHEYSIACLASIATHTPSCSFEVIVVDDASSDATSELLPRVFGLRYVRNENNLGFLRSVNRGASLARGRYLFFLNNDTQLQAGSIDALVDVFNKIPSAGVAGSKLIYPSGHLQEAGAVLNADGSVEMVGLNGHPEATDYGFLREVDYCSGASFMIPRKLFESRGGFDDIYAPSYFEDADLSLRVRAAGRKVIYQPTSRVIHHLSITTNDHGVGKLAQVERNKEKFLYRWRATLNEHNRVRLIAFFLPQFHPIPENDTWWGKGFTEWTNVTRATPIFRDHQQPHVPGELGYYDLRIPETRDAQSALAREHGVYGFCYYYYWFAGRRLLHRPLDEMLRRGEPRQPFCVCWANESWSRRWDGQENQILIKQSYSSEDDIAFIKSLFPLFSDDRYIRICGRPILLVYRVEDLPNPQRTVERWRRACHKAGLADPYLIRVLSFGSLSDSRPPAEFGFDAAVEFPPHGLAVPTTPPAETSADFRGVFYDYVATAKAFRAKSTPPYRLFKTVMPSWDNTARRQNAANIFLNSNPAEYETWLRDAITVTRRFSVGDERIVFINAWNEWAEGNHLEPDVRYGRAFLEATRRAWVAACGQQLPASLDWVVTRDDAE